MDAGDQQGRGERDARRFQERQVEHHSALLDARLGGPQQLFLRLPAKHRLVVHTGELPLDQGTHGRCTPLLGKERNTKPVLGRDEAKDVLATGLATGFAIGLTTGLTIGPAIGGPVGGRGLSHVARR